MSENRAPLYNAAKAVLEDWQDRVSLGYEGGWRAWPQMVELADLFDEIDAALSELDRFREGIGR